MVKKRLLNFKNVFGAVIVVLFVVVIATLVILNSAPRYNDDYFRSDGSKLVSQIEAVYYEGEDDTPDPLAAYMVYYYSGEKITEVKVFYKFESEEVAKSVYEDAAGKEISWAKEKSYSGVYLILSLVDSEFKDLNTTLVRSMMEE